MVSWHRWSLQDGTAIATRASLIVDEPDARSSILHQPRTSHRNMNCKGFAFARSRRRP
jgi:hypothetical protein